MKFIITIAVIYLVWMALVFGAFAFGQWSLNPALWSKDSREVCALLSIVVGFIISAIASAYIDKEY